MGSVLIRTITLSCCISLVVAGCGGSSNVPPTSNLDVGEPDPIAPTTTSSSAECTELRTEYEQRVAELGGIEATMGPFEENSEREILHPIGVAPDYPTLSEPPHEFLIEAQSRFIFEVATGWVYAATFPAVSDLYGDLQDKGCDLAWLANLTQPVRDSYMALTDTNWTVEPLPGW